MPPGAPTSAVGAPGPSRSELWRARVLLVALSISFAEVLTGSTPWRNLLSPIALVGLLGFYGAGSLLIRELSLRWRNGWVSTLCLGLAYGICEEGLALKTMVDPAAGAPGILDLYGRFLGVNWVFAFDVDLFHAIFSIGLPILLVGLAYPSTQRRPLLPNPALPALFALFAFVVTWTYLFFDPRYFEGPLVLAALLLAVGALALVAWYGPGRWLLPPTATPDRSPRWFFLVGALVALLWNLLFYLAPKTLPVPVLVILGTGLTVFLAGRSVVRHSGRRGNERHLLSLAAGLLLWFVPLDLAMVVLGADVLVALDLVLIALLLWRLHRAYRPARSDQVIPA